MQDKITQPSHFSKKVTRNVDTTGFYLGIVKFKHSRKYPKTIPFTKKRGVITVIYKELAEIIKKNGYESIPEHCSDLAKEYKSRISEILAGKDLTEQWKRDRLFINVMYFYRNVADKSNERIEEWLDLDKDAAKLFMKLTTEYESCGWQDISTAPFNFENEISKKLLDELYLNAVEFFKKERVTN